MRYCFIWINYHYAFYLVSGSERRGKTGYIDNIWDRFTVRSVFWPLHILKKFKILFDMVFLWNFAFNHIFFNN